MSKAKRVNKQPAPLNDADVLQFLRDQIFGAATPEDAVKYSQSYYNVAVAAVMQAKAPRGQ